MGEGGTGLHLQALEVFGESGLEEVLYARWVFNRRLPVCLGAVSSWAKNDAELSPVETWGSLLGPRGGGGGVGCSRFCGGSKASSFPGLAAVGRINAAIRNGVAEKTVVELMSAEAQLPPVYPFAAELYQRELATLQQQSPDVSPSKPTPRARPLSVLWAH